MISGFSSLTIVEENELTNERTSKKRGVGKTRIAWIPTNKSNEAYCCSDESNESVRAGVTSLPIVIGALRIGR